MLDSKLLDSIKYNTSVYHQQKGVYNSLRQSRTELLAELEVLDNRHKAIEEASVLIQETAKESQETIKYQLSSLVTEALETIYPEHSCVFDLSFNSERGQTSVYPLLIIDGNELDPMDNSGGMAEIIAFALRIALIAIGKKDKILMLDEPFVGVSQARIPLVQEFLKQMGEDFEMQFIITTHIPKLTEDANKSFILSKVGKSSVVRES